jgi:predicted peroxiredoxin
MLLDKILFVITMGLEDPTRDTRSLQLAKVAKDMGKEVNIFLTDDAVLLSKPGIVDQFKAPTGDEANDYLDSLIENKVSIHV